MTNRFVLEKVVFEKNLFHEASVLLAFAHVNDQLPFREDVIRSALKDEGVELASVDAFVGRGGSACTQPGGLTVIDRKLYDDTVAGVGGSEHPAKLGVMLAWKLSGEGKKPVFTLNPTNVDEYCELTVADTVPYLTYDVDGAATPQGFGRKSRRMARKARDGRAGGEITLEVEPAALSGADGARFFRVVRK